MKYRPTCALLIVVIAATPLLAQLPDSPTGRGGNALIQLFKSGPDSVTDKFIEERFSQELLSGSSVEEYQKWLMEAVETIGPLELRGVDKTADFAASISGLSSNTGKRVEIRYEVANTPPHQFVLLEIDEGSGGPQLQLSQAEMVAEAQEYLDGLSADEFSGSVLIARGKDVLLEKANGLASRRYSVPNNMETLFNLGSINKIFTKIAIAQLASQAKLNFDDTVAKHLPDYPNQEVAEKITIQQVATHSAGLGDIFTDEFATTGKERFQTPEDYFVLFAQEPLLFEPGTSQRYSNGGYMVLGAIVAAVSGMTYDEYVQQKIFDPAGMTSTGSHAMDEPVPNLAKGYTQQTPGDPDDDHHGHGPDPDAPWRENSFMIPFTGTPAGGGYSNATDLLHFRHAMVENRLLDSRYTQWVVTNKLPEQAPADNGFGIGVAGGAPGVNAGLEFGGEYTIIALFNLDPPSASSVARHLRELVESVQD